MIPAVDLRYNRPRMQCSVEAREMQRRALSTIDVSLIVCYGTRAYENILNNTFKRHPPIQIEVIEVPARGSGTCGVAQRH
jgi:hypothetical protein